MPQESPIESAPCNATAESIAITETLICDELEAIKNGMGYQPAWTAANKDIFHTVFSRQTRCGYADIVMFGVAKKYLLEAIQQMQ